VTGAHLADYTQSIVNGTLTVTQAGSTTSLSVTSDSITPGQSIALTATVASATTGTPTGTVSFYDNNVLLNASPAPLTAGAATYITTTLAPGVTHTITAAYSGDNNFTASTSTLTTPVVVAPLDFTMVISGPASQTVAAGNSISYQAKVTPMYGSYAGTVKFAVSGLPPGASVNVSPSSISANDGPQTVTLTIQTAATAANGKHSGDSPLARRAAPLALALLMLFGAGGLRRNGRGSRRMLCLMLLVASGVAATLVSGCGGNSSNSKHQQPQSYTITVTATAGNLQHTAIFTLTVQ
jgi:predicted component of type VI protein secretion system